MAGHCKRFYLLGKCSCPNPSAISREQKLIQKIGAKGRALITQHFHIHNLIVRYQFAVSQAYNDRREHKAQNLILSQQHTESQKPILAFVSNTSYAMYNFRLKVLQTLSAQNFAIHIIAPFDSSTKKLQQEGFFVHHLHIDSRSLNPFKDLRTLFELRHILKTLKPRFVFNYTIKPAIYSSALCHKLKIPHIAIITGLGYVFIKGGIKKNILRTLVCKMYRFALKHTKEVWFLNDDDKAEFLSYKLIKEHQAFILHSEGVDCEYFTPREKLHEKNAESNEIIFLLIGRMLWDKGVGEFVEAARMLLQETNQQTEGHKLRFLLLGASNCPNPSAISREQIAQWEKEGVIEYLGEVEDVRGVIESAFCVVLPSFREGVSMSLLEAMAMGKPIITSNAIGCKNLLKPSYNGFICEVGNAHSLAQAMRSMRALTPKEYQRMCLNARDFVSREYNIKRIIGKYIQVIHLYLEST